MKKLLLIITFLFSLNLSAAIIADYRMDECSWNGTAGEVKDQTGNYDAQIDVQNTATTTGESVINRAGAFNQASNTQSAVRVPLNVLNNSATNFTFTAWVRPTSALGDWDAFLSGEEVSGNDDDTLLFGTGGGFSDGTTMSGRIQLSINGEHIDFMDVSSVVQGQWNFVAIAKHGNSVCMAINDPSIASNYVCKSYSSNILNSLAALNLAFDSGYSTGEFHGYMDESKFFDTQLSQTELKTIYDRELNTTNYDDGLQRTPVVCSFSGGDPIVNYHMDECYWFDNANGLTGDVKDSGSQRLDATSYSGALIDQVDALLNFSGTFNGSSDYIDRDDAPILSFTNQMSVSLWVKPTRQSRTEVYVAKYDGTDGWAVFFYNGTTDYIVFQVNIGGTYYNALIPRPANWTNNWHFITAVYDGNAIKLYVDQSTPNDTNNQTGNIINSPDPLVIGYYGGSDYFSGKIDELKIWNSVLTDTQVGEIYNRELNGVDFTGNGRQPVNCQAHIAANTWEQVSIPAEMRGKSYTIADIFSDDISGAYGTDWVVAKHVQTPLNEDDDYRFLDYNGSDPYNGTPEVLQFGKGYYLASFNDYNWSVNNLEAADFNVTTVDCNGSRCIEIPLFYDTSFDNYVGDTRYTMVSFPGKSAVNWANCRFVINGTAYTPTAAENAGYTIKEIWTHDAVSRSYSSCSDDGIGACKLIPYEGFWVGLKKKLKDDGIADSVKLLVPQE